jgi:hypothetical protein
MLKKPELKHRDTKSKPKINSVIGDPFDINSKYFKTSFNFFTNGNVVKDKVWDILIADTPNINQTLVFNEILSIYGKQCLFENLKFLNKYGMVFEIILFFDSLTDLQKGSPIYIVELSLNKSNIVHKISQKSLIEFEDYVFLIQGAPSIMNKPLIYSRTELEGYLSDICQRGNNAINKSIFPGDVDLVLYDKNLDIKNVFEFKKHTDSGQGIIEDQSFLKYINLDIKKYTAIAILAQKLNKDYFYNIIYSTREKELNKIKIEKISNKLALISSEIKIFKNKDEFKVIIELL